MNMDGNTFIALLQSRERGESAPVQAPFFTGQRRLSTIRGASLGETYRAPAMSPVVTARSLPRHPKPSARRASAFSQAFATASDTVAEISIRRSTLSKRTSRQKASKTA